MAIATSTAILAGTLGAGAMSAMGARAAGKAQSAAAKRGIEAQVQANRESIEFQKQQFALQRELMDPFREAGLVGLEQMMALGGMSGPEAEAAAIQQIAEGEPFKFYEQQATQGILGGASATGGLRGGNVQRQLAEIRPNLLNSLVNERYSRLAGLSSAGQSAAAGQGSAAMALGANVGNTLLNRGQAIAQGEATMGAARAGQSLGTFGALGQGFGALQQMGLANAMGMFNDDSGVSKLGLIS